MSDLELPRLCQHVTDLVRGRPVRLGDDECQALRPFVHMGLLEMREPECDGQATHCRCRHPRLFEFHFYYRWLPRNAQLFHPQRE
ncbi:hypothetical protein [Pseudomonas citronellolis]|uniref:hypothetical protein n=1 Tax=Pseudomonas citronellolis TaxID=53408 RepID=UPI0023E39159|nr:hypothetical protein [Pseudomonas citronellolis]MDF3931060.1 hypothetical protein [Pseudomonas citronellolis]